MLGIGIAFFSERKMSYGTTEPDVMYYDLLHLVGHIPNMQKVFNLMHYIMDKYEPGNYLVHSKLRHANK